MPPIQDAPASTTEERARLRALLQAKQLRENTFPLSFAQERLWFLDQLEGPSSTYNMRYCLRLKGPLDVNALKRALAAVVKRHESLRTTFKNDKGVSRQVVHSSMPVTLPLIDLQRLENEVLQGIVASLSEQFVRQPFDLARGPLYQTILLKEQPNQYLLCLVLHHIVSDGLSMGIFVRDTVAFYRHYASGEPNHLPELTIQYADFSKWQKNQLRGSKLDELVTYWRSKLEGAPALLTLPTDRPRPPVQTFRGDRVTFEIDRGMTRELRKVARESGATLFMTSLGIFGLLLSHYSGKEDLVIGSSVANRMPKETEPLIGFFVNMLPLRVKPMGSNTFPEYVRQIRQTVHGSLTHMGLPFEKLIAEINPERGTDHQPVFQVLFEFLNLEEGRLEVPGLQIERLPVETGTAKLDLSMFLAEKGDGLYGELEYSLDLFDASTINEMVRHYKALLKDIVANPNRSLSDFSPLDPDERRRMLQDWNRTEQVLPQAQGFHRLFEDQVARTPDRVAVVFRDHQRTYQALNEDANRLAHLLVSEGLGPEKICVISGERSIDMLVSILAIFKAGGAYLPVETDMPSRRFAHVLESSRPHLVLCSPATRKNVDESCNLLAEEKRPKVLSWELTDTDPGDLDNLSYNGDHRTLAYIIFTSGSTGLPKGAMVTQRGMINHLHAKLKDLTITESDRIAQNASQCFDISVWQFLAALLVGGRVQIFENEIAHDPSALLKQSSAQGITLLEVVPSILRWMLESLGSTAPPDLRTLRWLIPTGEALSPKLARAWLRQFPRIPLLNAYGPTECSDDVTHEAIAEPPPEETIHMPIGRPVINTRIHVVDKYFNPVTAGVPGRCLVAGTGVGRGYVNSPARTATSFLPDPFSGETGARIYDTGDLVRYARNGLDGEVPSLIFLGRADYQVKIRGFRLELGEIETILQKHSDIREAAVLAKDRKTDSGRGDTFLAAYVTLEGEKNNGLADPSAHQEQIEEWRQFLSESLPAYMIPSNFIILDDLPLTANGKIDRRALPDPGTETSTGPEQVPPRTPVEIKLAEIWSEMMDTRVTSIHSNFFELGGHSLMAIQVLSRIREELGVSITLVELFQMRTIEELAKHIDKCLAIASQIEAPKDTVSEDEMEFRI